jgi:glucose/arabinose dehydrogenase
MAGLRAPVLFFTPSGASFYTGSVFPNFRNDLFVATLRGSHLHRVTFSSTDPRVVTSDERLVEDAFGRVRDVVTGPDGALFLYKQSGRAQQSGAWGRPCHRLVPST